MFSEEPEIITGISGLLFQSREEDSDMKIRPSQNYFIVKVLEDLNGGDDMDWQFMLYASGDLVDGNDPEEVLIA